MVENSGRPHRSFTSSGSKGSQFLDSAHNAPYYQTPFRMMTFTDDVPVYDLSGAVSERYHDFGPLPTEGFDRSYQNVGDVGRDYYDTEPKRYHDEEKRPPYGPYAPPERPFHRVFESAEKRPEHTHVLHQNHHHLWRPEQPKNPWRMMTFDGPVPIYDMPPDTPPPVLGT